MSEFTDWLEKELQERQWTYRDLARQADITHAAISLVMNEARQPGEKFCREISKALDIPPVFVFRLAGLLPKTTTDEQHQETLLFYFEKMGLREKLNLIRIARALAEEREDYGVERSDT